MFFQFSDFNFNLVDNINRSFILPANPFLRMAGFPLNSFFKIKSIDYKKFLRFTSHISASLWNIVKFENCYLVVGDKGNVPSKLELIDIYTNIFSAIPSYHEVFILPFTKVWGGQELSELDAIFSINDKFSHRTTVLLSSSKLIRFPNDFFNPLKRELESFSIENSSMEKKQALIARRAIESEINPNIVLFCMGYPQLTKDEIDNL